MGGNVMANVWILVLKNYTTPKQYICKSDPVAGTPAAITDATNKFWMNFNGGSPDNTYSYSFAYPWTVPTSGSGTIGAWWHNTTDSSLPIMADMAPLNGSGTNPITQTPGQVSTSNGGLPANGAKAWNSPNHQREGENVGYGDGHAEFSRRADIGQSNDNFYTENGASGAGSGNPNIGTAISVAGTVPGPYVGGTGNPYDIVMVPVANVSTGTRQ